MAAPFETIGDYTIYLVGSSPQSGPLYGIMRPDGSWVGASDSQVIIDRIDINGEIASSHVDKGRACKEYLLHTARDTCRQLIASDVKAAKELEAKVAERPRPMSPEEGDRQKAEDLARLRDAELEAASVKAVPLAPDAAKIPETKQPKTLGPKG